MEALVNLNNNMTQNSFREGGVGQTTSHGSKRRQDSLERVSPTFNTSWENTSENTIDVTAPSLAMYYAEIGWP